MTKAEKATVGERATVGVSVTAMADAPAGSVNTTRVMTVSAARVMIASAACVMTVRAARVMIASAACVMTVRSTVTTGSLATTVTKI